VKRDVVVDRHSEVQFSYGPYAEQDKPVELNFGAKTKYNKYGAHGRCSIYER